MILDNRDSFVFNLAHRFWEVDQPVAVVRSDAINLADLVAWEPSALVVSPGPGHPDQAGISVAAIRRFSGAIPILGICLGHQAIARAYGGRVEAGGKPVHGMSSDIEHDGEAIFDGLPTPLRAARYHSLVTTEIPERLVVNARADGFVMGLRHRQLPVFGLQFHPESVLTPDGRELLRNFCSAIGRREEL